MQTTKGTILFVEMLTSDVGLEALTLKCQTLFTMFKRLDKMQHNSSEESEINVEVTRYLDHCKTTLHSFEYYLACMVQTFLTQETLPDSQSKKL